MASGQKGPFFPIGKNFHRSEIDSMHIEEPKEIIAFAVE